MNRIKASLDYSRIRRLIWLVLTIFVLLGYSLQSVTGSAYYSMLIQAYGTVGSPPVILQNGTAGTSTIYANKTSAKVSVEAPLIDYVDNNDPDVDSSADKGMHSNFTAQQAGPDSTYDTLSEDTGEVIIEDYVDNEDSDMDGSADQGTLTDFANLTAYDSNYANFSETVGGEDNEYSVDLTGDYLISDSADMTSATGTIEMWVQFDAVSGRFYGLDGNMEIRYSAGWIFDWGGTGSMTSSHTPSVTTWYHYSWTWDETANDLFFYVGTESTAPSLDAGSPASGSWTGTVSTIPFTDVYIGNGKGGTGIIDGHFDDVRYWSDVRTLTEIQDNYNKTLEGNEAGLVNYWKLENDLTDSAGTDDLTTSGASYAFSTDVPSNWEPGTDCQFDHEVQFTTVIDFLATEKLCIYAGSFGGSEDINVTYWGGSSWSSITSDLTASSWNNYTVSLTSANFTIKFGGSNTTGDSVQDYWLIDAVLLQVSGAGSSEIAVDNDTSDVDTSDDEGSLTDFSYMKAYDSSYANFTETSSGGDIEFVNSTETVAASGDLVISVPDGVQDGDFMISFLGHSNDDPAVTLTPASGWNLQRGKTDMGTRATSPPVIWIYYRVANSEPSSYTWQFSTAGARIGFCLAYRNVDAIDIDSLNAQTGTGGTAISPDISTNNDGDWIISFVWHDDDDPPDMTAPTDSGFTARHDAQDAMGGNGFGMGVGDELRATQGSTGNRTWTLTASEERSGIMLSITRDYTLDHEVQFTNVPTILPNAALCIYANSTDAEDISVDVWNVTGSSWYEVFSDLTASAWNNVSVVDYLTSENFTVRFRDGSPTGDTTTQDTWLINVALVHIWKGEAYCELDVEVQWTSADYTRTNEELCIRTGTFSGSEDIQVRVWNATGSSWHWVMNLTASQWNNVSITSYLTSNTFTVQFLGGTETGDTSQDSWNIDATLLYVWTGESAWLSGWDKRVKITIDHNDVDSALSNFPVLVCLSNSSGHNNDDVSFVFDEVGSNSKKIAVTKSDGTTQCYVEIEKWDYASEQAWLWVKVPSISNTSDTDLYLYYDKDHANNTDNVGDPNSTPAENVWDSNHIGVWHLDDTIVGSVDIGGGSSGTPSGTPSITPDAAYFDELNTANANGFITQVKINVDTVGDGDLRIMTCSRAGNTFTVRDFENLAVTGTGVQTFSVNLEVATGDYLGFWASTVSVERENYASSQYLYQSTAPMPSVGQQYSATQGANLLRLMIEGNGDAISVLDSTNNNNDGSVIGSEENIGQIDNAQDFDGTDDYVNISADLAQWLGKTASLSVWIKTTQTGNDTYWSAPGVTGVEENEGANDIFWGWIDASGRIGIQAGDTAGAKTTSAINDGNWHHIVMTRNSSSGEVEIYVDGILNDTATSDTGDKTTSFYSIGRIEDTGGTPEYFSGTIDEVRISNVSRSAAWINASYESGRDDLLDFASEEGEGTRGGTYDYVLRVNNTVVDSWQIRLKKYADTNISRLQKCEIYFHNSTDGTSSQIYIQNGSYTNQTGPWYDLGGSETIYIAMKVQANSPATSYIYTYLEILTPDTSTYAQYIITFEIT